MHAMDEEDARNGYLISSSGPLQGRPASDSSFCSSDSPGSPLTPSLNLMMDYTTTTTTTGLTSPPTPSSSSSSSKRGPGPPAALKLELESIELGLSSANTDTVSRESLLDELLGDIRRSCATSLASTPTMVSLSEGEGENVFECRLRRSEAELRTLGEAP